MVRASESGPPHACSSSLHWALVLESIHTGDWEIEKHSWNKKTKDLGITSKHSGVYMCTVHLKLLVQTLAGL